MAQNDENEVIEDSAPDAADDVTHFATIDIEVQLPNKLKITFFNVSVNETTNSIRVALSESRESAMYTCFSLRLCGLIDKENCFSPKLIKCNEIAELSSFVDHNTKRVVLEMVLDDYDVKKARVHVKRFRDLVAFPQMHKGIVSPEDERPEKSSTSAELKSCDLSQLLSKPEFLTTEISLGDFFKETLYRAGTPDEKKFSLTSVIKSVNISGWNPPPAFRKLQGDLMYLEVLTASEGTIHLTSSVSGFYVNKSNRNHFDPTPAANACLSHELFQTLAAALGSFRSAWEDLCKQYDHYVHDKQAQLASATGPLDSIANFVASGKEDPANVKPSWLFHPSLECEPSYDLYRSIEEYADLHGLEELGAPREWNDEIQSLRSLPANDFNEKMMKARLEYRVVKEFTDSCRTVAMAIVDGYIAPMMYSDPEQSEIYVYNGIFFSKAENSKDPFKLCNSDEAFRKCAGKDLANQRYIHSLGIEGLSSVLCTIVDYKGHRIICQSIIPGIFTQGESAAQLMYGILQPQKNLTVKDSSLKIMRALGEKLHIPVRNLPYQPFSYIEGAPDQEEVSPVASSDPMKTFIGKLEPEASPIKVDDSDSIPASDSGTIQHVGPVEGKILRGCDGRQYILEFMRVTPRDANYVPERGTGKIPAEVLQTTDASLGATYVLRHELVAQYIQHKINAERQKIMAEASELEKSLAGDAESKSAGEGTPTEEDAIKKAEDDEAQQKLSKQFAERFAAVTPASIALEINANVFFDFAADADKEVVQKDEDTARELAAFLWDVVLPSMTRHIQSGDYVPKDCESMVRILRRFGINMRYLGRLATLALEVEEEDLALLQQGKQRIQATPYYWLELLLVEIVARATKNVINQTLQQNKSAFAAPAATIAAVLSSILTALNEPAFPTEKPADSKDPKSGIPEMQCPPPAVPTKKSRKKKGGKAIEKEAGSAGGVPQQQAVKSMQEMLESISDIIQERFCLSIPLQLAASANKLVAVLRQRVSRPTLIRRICQLCGIRLAARAYSLQQKTGSVFKADDVMGMDATLHSCEQPVLLPEFQDIVASSAHLLQQGDLPAACDYAQQAINISHQITGPNHSMTVQAMDAMYAVLFAAGDLRTALHYEEKSLSFTVQLLGLDSHDSLIHHIQLSGLHEELQNPKESLQHLLTSIYLLKLMAGPHHPDLATMYARLSPLYEAAGDKETAIQCLLLARQMSSDLLKNSIITVALAELFQRLDMLPDAITTQRLAYTVLKQLLPETDERLISVKRTFEAFVRSTPDFNKKMVNKQLEMQLQQEQERMILKDAPNKGEMLIADDSKKKKRPTAKKGKAKK